MMLHSRSSSVFALALFFTCLTAPKPSEAAFFADSILAQSPAPTNLPPEALPTGATVRIDGSHSMATVNESLRQRFQEQNAGTDVELGYSGTAVALQSLLDGNIDLAAIGRPLTEDEKAQGLLEAPVGRQKIAIIVGENNPFTGNLTFEQFAGMFRGEITDWSAVGGAPGAIRFIDHPVESDTRQAFTNYPVFQAAPFENGATTVRLNEDTAAAIAAELGTDGIGYLIVSQATDLPGVRIVSMHDTLPDDPSYPYSQPLFYAYRANPSPAVAAFLGLAGATIAPTALAPSSSLVAESPAAVSPTASPVAPVPEVAQSPTAEPTPVVAASEQRGFPGWLWWLLPLIGLPILAWLLLKGRRTPTETVAPPPPAPTPVVPPPGEPTLAERAGTVISSDRTTISNAPIAEPPVAEPVITEPVAEPSVIPPVAAGIAGIAGAAAVLGGIGAVRQPNRITLTPYNAQQAYAFWEIPEANRAALKEQGGSIYLLRICDVTGLDAETQTPHSIQTYTCQESDQDRHVPIPQADRDYTAEIGYLTEDDRWLLLARSNPVWVAAESSRTVIQTPTVLQPEPQSAPIPAPIPAPPASLSPALPNLISLEPRSANQAYASWEVPEQNKAAARVQGGVHYTLRLCDVTGLDPATQTPHRIFQSICQESEQNRLVPIPQAGRDYVAEIGYLTEENRWLLLARSNLLQVTPAPVESPVPTEGITPDPGIAGTGIAAAIAANEFIASLTGDGDQEAIEATKFNVGQTDLQAEELADVDVGLPDLPVGYGDSQIVMLPRDPNWAYTYWDVPNEHREAVRRQGGSRLALRLYDVTEINVAYQKPHGLQQYDCDELARDWYIPIPVSDRDYIIEIGYLTVEGDWLMLARSNPARIPPVYPSDWLEEQFATVSWDDGLQSQNIPQLEPPGQKTSYGNPIYDRIFGLAESAEAQRVAGSLFGSMQQVPTEALSSHVFSSGAGMMSGVGMSGVGMSGVGMSGAGIYTTSGVGMSGVGIHSMSGAGMSGVGIYSMSGVGMSGVGMYSTSGVGMMSGIGMMSGAGMSGVGIYSMSGVGMSGVGMYSTSGMGMSGVGMYTTSGMGMSGVGMYSMAGAGMSGVGMYTASGVGMSGVGMYSMSGVGMSGIGFSASMPPIRPRKFWLVADAELIVHGATEPDATVMIGDREIKLSPDGTFRFQVAFPDGDLTYPVLAIAADGEQTRSIRMNFHRETPVRYTNTKEDAVEEWFN